MRLLAFDTAGNACSAGVFVDGRPVALRRSDGPGGHAEWLPRSLEAVLENAAITLEALDAIAVTVGPGSFSGIRTGLAAARGLALVTGLRAIPVTTLEALAAPLAHANSAPIPIAAILDARRGQVFLQRFAPDTTPLEPPRTLDPEAAAAELIGPWRLVGDGAGLVLHHLPPALARVVAGQLDAAGVARAAELALQRGAEPLAGFDLHPCYARDADARPGAGRPLLRVGA